MASIVSISSSLPMILSIATSSVSTIITTTASIDLDHQEDIQLSGYSMMGT